MDDLAVVFGSEVVRRVADGTLVSERGKQRRTLADSACSGRVLWLNSARHSYVDLADPTHLEFAYAQWITAAVSALPSPLDVLHRITELLRVAHGVRTAKRVPIPLAVVFAKMDAFFPVLGSDHPLLTRPPATSTSTWS